MDAMGLRSAIRAGTELCALGTRQPSFEEFIATIDEVGLKAALQGRDAPFHDYRTATDP
jgi:enoyl-CoA hydratase